MLHVPSVHPKVHPKVTLFSGRILPASRKVSRFSVCACVCVGGGVQWVRQSFTISKPLPLKIEGFRPVTHLPYHGPAHPRIRKIRFLCVVFMTNFSAAISNKFVVLYWQVSSSLIFIRKIWNCIKAYLQRSVW